MPSQLNRYTNRFNSRQFLLAPLLLAPLIVGLQNCAPPDVSSNTAGGTGRYASAAIALETSYTPLSPRAGDQVMLSAAGGTPPYTFSLINGGGQLNANVYTATAGSEVATILVKDDAGLSQPVSIVITAVGATGTVTGPAPTPIPKAALTSVAQVYVPGQGLMPRECDLAGYGAAAQASNSIPAFVGYTYCLFLLRDPSPQETAYFNKLMKNGDIDPYGVAYAVEMSQGFQDLYAPDNMTPEEYTAFLIGLLTFTNATPEQVGYLLSMAGTDEYNIDTRQTEFDYLFVSDPFNQANPIFRAAEQAYMDAAG